jgi:hypothetical protein
MKELVRAVVQDQVKFDEVEIIEAFLGSDAAALLDKVHRDKRTCRH